MKTRWLTITLCLFVLIHTPAYGQNSNDLMGVWHESRATLTITAIAPSGQLTGTYTPGTADRVFPVAGWVNMVTPKGVHVVPVLFTSKGGVYGTITAWSGYLSKGNDGRLSITTIWNIVRAYADPDSAPDNAAVTIAVFTPGPAR